MAVETIIAAAVRRGLEGKSGPEIEAETLKLHLQVGELETALAQVALNCAGGRNLCAQAKCAGRQWCGCQEPAKLPGFLGEVTARMSPVSKAAIAKSITTPSPALPPQGGGEKSSGDHHDRGEKAAF